ncbi:MAG: hypothetical protein WCP19_04900 [Chloroflexota bacterium]
MISEPDIIRIPYTPDLTESGIAFAKRWLCDGHASPAASISAQMRKQVCLTAAELSFRRYLTENTIPFEVKNLLPFSDPGQFNVSLGGHRCIINQQLVQRRNLISDLRNDPQKLLAEPVYILEEELPSADRYGKEILVFCTLFALTAQTRDDQQKAEKAGQPACLIYPFNPDPGQKIIRGTPASLLLKSESETPVEVEIGGLDVSRKFSSEKILLPALKSRQSINVYSDLSYIQIHAKPAARIALKAGVKQDAIIIHPEEWHNIWIYGLETWLPGFMLQDEFRRKSAATYHPSRLSQADNPGQKRLSLACSELHPLGKLFEQVKNWKNGGKIW